MTEEQQCTSEAFERLKTETSELADTTVCAAKQSLTELQESLKRVEDLIGDAAGKYDRCIENIRENPVAAVSQSAGVGFLVGWLCGEKKLGQSKETGMAQAESDTIRMLQKKIRAMQEDIAQLTSSASDELQCVAKQLREKYEDTTGAAKEFVEKNPGKTTIAAGVLGFAAGFLLHLMLKGHEGTT